MKKKLSRGTVKLIKEAIISAKNKELAYQDRYVLCSEICELMEQRYHGRTLDYQLSRMNLETTLPILEAIDTFFYTSPSFLSEELEIFEQKLNEKEYEADN